MTDEMELDAEGYPAPSREVPALRERAPEFAAFDAGVERGMRHMKTIGRQTVPMWGGEDSHGRRLGKVRGVKVWRGYPQPKVKS